MKRRKLLIWGRNISINLHSLHPWVRGDRLPACKGRRRTQAAAVSKQQEPPPLPFAKQSRRWCLLGKKGSRSLLFVQTWKKARVRPRKRSRKQFGTRQPSLLTQEVELPVAVGRGGLWGPVSSKWHKKEDACIPAWSKGTKGGARGNRHACHLTLLGVEYWSKGKEEILLFYPFLCSWALWEKKAVTMCC